MDLQIIIQARTTSTRLPAKVLLPLCGATVLEIMLRRLTRFKDKIIVATTDDDPQHRITSICKQLHVKHFEGDTQNVLSRYYSAATYFGANDDTVIVRCTSDCPLIDADIVQRAIDLFHASEVDYVCACTDSGFPRGMDSEIFCFSSLKDAYLNASSLYEQEHVTPYIRAHAITEALTNQYNHSKYRLTLDEKDDYKAIVSIYEKLGCRVDFSYEQLIAILEKYPYLYEINKHVEQKKYNH
jgi:spore coat polysaccharide biosynthesis protein SpsF